MTLKIRKSILMQYILIYIMLIVPGSCLFAKYWEDSKKYFILLTLYTFLFFYKKKYRNQYTIILVLFMFFVTMFTRFMNGGAGLNSWLHISICFISTQFAISCDESRFIERWIKMVVCLSAISIIFWLIFCIAPELVNIWNAKSYLVQSIGSKGYETYWYGKGLIFYSYLQIHATRNCGIFTEPGVYQVVLNSALFVLLFWRDKLGEITFKQYKKFLVIILISLITCQSTTGYIGMLLILLYFYISKNIKNIYSFKIKKLITICLILILSLLFIDYSIKGKQSIFYLQIVNKLFGGNSGTVDISQGTGQYRLGTIIVSIATVIKYPLGVGIDVFDSMKNAYGQGLVAASLASFAAIYGIIPWTIILISIFKPVLIKEKLSLGILYIGLFINTTLAQTDLFYPSLLMIPIYLVMRNNKQMKNEGDVL